MPHDWEKESVTNFMYFTEDHLTSMADNQMNLSSEMRSGFKEIKDRLDILNGTTSYHKTRLAVHDNTLKWLWIIGGIVVSGIGIAIGAIWVCVF